MDRVKLIKNHLSSKSTEVLTLHDSEDPKKLLQKYRSKSTINHQDVLNVLWGRHVGLRKEILDIMTNDPIYKQYTVNENNRKELRQLSLKWIKTFKSRFDKLTYDWYKKDPAILYTMISTLYEFDASLSVKVGVHTSLYGKTIINLGTEKHSEYVERCFDYEDIGCFGLTELGHGSNARGVLTRADFDPKTREFVINTPVDIAMKFWIGAAANLANMSVIMAQLFIGDKNYGVHGFIVPIRNKQDHTLLPGVIVGDCGLKVGLNAIDNGFLMFKNVRVPYDNLLDKFSQITPEGKFKSPIKSADKRFGISLGSLSGGRLQLIDATNSSMRNSLTIATRFAACRRQFGPPQQVEQNILEYPLVQYRLIPYLAETFASATANHQLSENWNNNQDKIFSENNPMLAEIHAVSSTFKGVASWVSQRCVQECREMCGGLGYSAYNRLGQIREDNDINATWEGDNNVLCQQTSKFLMDSLRNLKGGNPLPYETLKYLKEELDLNEYAVGADGKSAWARTGLNLERAFEARSNWLIHISFEQLGKNMMSCEDAWTAWNSSHVFYLRDAAIAYCEAYILSEFGRGIARSKDEKTTVVLRKLYELYGLNKIVSNYGNYLEIGYLTKDDVNYARERVKELCKELKDEVIGLIDAVAVSDQLLNSPIGASDGDIYNRFITAVWTAPGCFERAFYWRDIRHDK